MLKLPKLTDYAVVILARMAQQPERLHSAAGLADGTGLTVPTVAKILKQLARSQLLTTQRGTRGGYRLERSAAAVTIADIVIALDGPVSLTACVDTSHQKCGVASRCAMHGQWNAINRAILDVLAGVTLQDMATPRVVTMIGHPAAPTVTRQPAGA
jgi:FeS assembly SUF system regulator